MLNHVDYFSIGVYITVFSVFMYMYSLDKEEKYNLYFALGSLIAIIRVVVTFENIPYFTSYAFLINVAHDIYFISYMCGGLLLMMIAEQLFEEESIKPLGRGLIFAVSMASVFIIILPMQIYVPVSIIFDVLLIGTLIYVNYIFVKAVIRKRNRSFVILIGNLIMCFGAVHDVLWGNGNIKSVFGEINPYTYMIYLMIFGFVLAKNFREYQAEMFKSELNFLHAQIQPHFLFNAINTIVTYCRKDPNVAKEMLMDLSIYLRGKFDFDSENMMISLKEELELIKAYLTIEMVRFGDRLEVVYDIDENIDITVPCLIFQPLVENSVKHGLKGNVEGVTVKISVKRVMDDIVLKVEDNGKGMSPETLDMIFKREDTGVGLKNIRKRLKLYYKTDIQIRSVEDEGTCIEMKIPTGG